ncbi:MAG TPA: glycogen debranching N-terminal domain-containing protein [Candidatus Acidoferrum sp.]|jgi:glycogen debranching enzyme|nr:glycogen debranching N-terminal domain-containing protein [Candidatus Acidoferrum sp.]
MAESTISILEGNTFVVSDRRGDVEASPTDTHGLFHNDTRFLSRWVLTVDGQRPNVLSVDSLNYFATQFFLVPGTGTVYVDSPLSIVRHRAVGQGFHEDLTILNHTADAKDLEVRLEADGDFADLFEVKDALAKKGERYRRVQDGRLVLGYRRDRFVRETWISTDASATIDERGLGFRVHLDPHGTWKAGVDVATGATGADRAPTRPKYAHATDEPRPNTGSSLEEWLGQAPKLVTSSPQLQQTYRRSLVDLAALRFFPLMAPGQALPAAGLPWFMAVFGRDSILTSLQALPFTPELARTTLTVLGLRQGTVRDDFRDEEPGRILHESRAGEMTAFEERPHSPYFGSTDATPLYLILLDEYERWTGDVDLVRKLEPQARAALQWIDKWGDRDGDGYVEYERRNTKTGLENQCWKDSWNSILFADGTLAPLPRATCEIQGYVYDAKRRCARLARDFWGDNALAEQLTSQAADLKRRFNTDFWIPERGFFALALDGKKRKVDALTSNIGHLLWSGIADEDKARACVDHLLGDRLFSGWGVRTMAASEGGYNPIGYHVGTVWPFDNSFIAWGLRRYRYDAEAARVALGILDAAVYFDGRLPEAFAGYPRSETRFPVEYPTACSPQAWSTGAPLLLLRTLLGLEPVGERLLFAPAIPTTLERLELLDIPGRWGRADAIGRGRIDLGASAGRS